MVTNSSPVDGVHCAVGKLVGVKVSIYMSDARAGDRLQAPLENKAVRCDEVKRGPTNVVPTQEAKLQRPASIATPSLNCNALPQAYPALPDAKRNLKVFASPHVHAHIVAANFEKILLKMLEEGG